MSYSVKFPMGAKRHVPIVKASFHTATKCYQVKGEVLKAGSPLDPNNQLVSISSAKMLNSPAGTFTMQLVGDEWLSRLQSNDVVVISMGYKAEGSATQTKADTVMVGLIDRVRRNRGIGGGEPQVMTTVTGRDFGKVLIKALLKFYPEVGMTSEAKEGHKFFLTDEGWMTLQNFFTGKDAVRGSHALILDTIMNDVLPKLYDVSWTVWDEEQQEPTPKTVGLLNVLRYSFAQTNFFTLPTYMAMDTYEGNIWNLMERASNRPFTELFVDTLEDSAAWNPTGENRAVPETIQFDSGGRPDAPPATTFGDDKAKVVLAFRNTPFDKEQWDKLLLHDLQAEDVISEDLEFSDDEHVNLFWAGQEINPLLDNLKRVSPPLFNEADAKRYGLAPMEVQVSGIYYDPKASDENKLSLVELSQNYTAKLKAWFENNHKYMNGTMEVRGKGSYKVGQRLLREGIGREFYIEGVSQNFHVYMDWTTNLTLTRGMAIGNQPVAALYAPKSPEDSPEKPTSQKTDEEIGARYYTTQPGDSLWSIAAKREYYKDGNQWTKIWEANKDALLQRDPRNQANPGRYVYANTVLHIP